MPRPYHDNRMEMVGHHHERINLDIRIMSWNLFNARMQEVSYGRKFNSVIGYGTQ